MKNENGSSAEPDRAAMTEKMKRTQGEKRLEGFRQKERTGAMITDKSRKKKKTVTERERVRGETRYQPRDCQK